MASWAEDQERARRYDDLLREEPGVVSEDMHPNDRRTLQWMRERERESGRPATLEDLQRFRGWTRNGARMFVARMQKDGHVGHDRKVTRAS